MILLSPAWAWAYRPFVSTDAAVAEPKECEIELGYFNLEHTRHENTITTPSLVLNYDFITSWEAVAEFTVEACARCASFVLSYGLDMAVSGSVTRPRGFHAAGGTCGIKESGKPDLMLIAADVPCAAAAVFTTNRVVGAPVVVNRRHLAATAGRARAIVCNSGVSNSATGAQGLRDAQAMCGAVAERIGCAPDEVLVSSTGVIGRLLPMPKILRGIEALHGRLGRGPRVDAAAAAAIVTTDLTTKSASRRLRLGGRTVSLGGIAKGSGMIAPNMATMLVFITTDCAIAPRPLQAALREATRASFNRISVDEDADRIGRAIVNSPLVKTALHGGDPNWGRIVTAAGYSGAAIRAERLSLAIGGMKVFERGSPVAVTATRRLGALMRRKEVTFTLDVGMGPASVEWLGCDLSRDYIAINADYTT